jgi:hypothetical protein
VDRQGKEQVKFIVAVEGRKRSDDIAEKQHAEENEERRLDDLVDQGWSDGFDADEILEYPEEEEEAGQREGADDNDETDQSYPLAHVAGSEAALDDSEPIPEQLESVHFETG